MSATTTHIETTLTRVRSGVKTWAAVRGGALLGLALAGAVVLSFLLDYGLRLDRISRAVVGVLLVAGLVVLARRVLVRPLRTKLTDDDLAVALERRFPRLGERLVSAVQFRRRLEAPDGVSPELMRTVLERAEGEVEELPLRRLFDARTIGRLALLAGSVLLALIVLAICFSDTASLWFRRDILLSTAEWPRSTRFEVEGFVDGTLRVPRGESVAVTARAIGDVPRRVEIDYEFDGGLEGEAVLSELAGDRFRHVFRDLVEPVSFRISGGDGLAGPYRIEVADRPAAESMSLHLTFPDYLGRGPAVHDVLSGGLSVPEGTSIEVRARTRAPVASAALRFGVKDLEFELRDGRDVVGRFSPEEGDILTLSLVDHEGLSSEPAVKVNVRVVPDGAPVATLRAVDVGGSVTPQAVLPLEVSVRDDHGLTSAVLRRRLISPAEDPTELPPDPLVELDLTESRAEAAMRRDLSDLGLEPGQSLRIVVAVQDDDGLHGTKEGLSDPLTFRIVTREDLLAEMIRRQQEVRRDLERVLERVLEDRGDFEKVHDAVARTPVPDETTRELVELARSQRRSGRRVSELADRFDRILAEMRNNRLLRESETSVLSSAVARPMRRLVDGPFPTSARRVEESGAAPSSEERGRAHGSALRGYDDVIGGLRRILEALERAEGFSELVERLRQVARLESELRAATEEEYRRRISELFPDEDENKEGDR